jgi:hypothetical protein
LEDELCPIKYHLDGNFGFNGQLIISALTIKLTAPAPH